MVYGYNMFQTRKSDTIMEIYDPRINQVQNDAFQKTLLSLKVISNWKTNAIENFCLK